MQSGWRYLNTATVRRCCLALSKCVVASFPSQASQLLMVIGYDHRQHSLEFADCAARTLAGRGINVLLMQDVIATPLLVSHCTFMALM
jgi:phosphomannomutase